MVQSSGQQVPRVGSTHFTSSSLAGWTLLSFLLCKGRPNGGCEMRVTWLDLGGRKPNLEESKRLNWTKERTKAREVNSFIRLREAVVKIERYVLKRSQDQVTNWMWGWERAQSYGLFHISPDWKIILLTEIRMIPKIVNWALSPEVQDSTMG